MTRLRRLWRPDSVTLAVLTIIWLIFFWRLFTPIAAHQAAFVPGDFSGQFVAFGAYQYERMAAGEIPLWNPYNNAGLPFIADTQAAVFYPPRLVTLALSSLAGGWSYNALQLEAAAHVLLLSCLMYAFVRRVLGRETVANASGAFIAALIVSYGGFTGGYPPLQLALLEASIWLPLAALGIWNATQGDYLNWRGIVLAAVALAISWLAGHPQTSWFLTYAIVAWLAYRVYRQRYSWRAWVWGTALMGVITLGLTAVTLLPGAEYLLLASRADMSFEAKSNGFPVRDVVQFILPGSVSLFSPLYVGIPALALIVIAVVRRAHDALFWLVVAIFALLLSFGGNTPFYPALYNVLPGLRFFRGQERAAYLVAHSLAILAGIGAAYFIATPALPVWMRRVLRYGTLALGLFAAGVVIAWLGNRAAYDAIVGTAILSAIIAIVFYGLVYLRHRAWIPQAVFIVALALLITFDLFNVTMNAPSNYVSGSASDQLRLSPPLVQSLLNDAQAINATVYRVDGFRGLQANYGSVYGLMDIRGISPLFLQSADILINGNYSNNYLAWELFAVRYAYGERETFTIPTTVIATGPDLDGVVNLHRLENPRPFALLVYDAAVVDSDDFARALLNDPLFDERNAVILHQAPSINLPNDAPPAQPATVTHFAPETVTIDMQSDHNAVLSVAMVDYPGWQATLNGEPVAIRRAYGGLMALEVPAGTHTVQLHYNPLSYRIGAILSLITWLGVVVVGAMSLLQHRRRDK